MPIAGVWGAWLSDGDAVGAVVVLADVAAARAGENTTGRCRFGSSANKSSVTMVLL